MDGVNVERMITSGLTDVGTGWAGARSKWKFFASFFQKRSAFFFCLLHSVAAGLAGKSRMPAFAGMTRNAG